VFQLTPPKNNQSKWHETVLYSFCTQPNCTDGSNPYGRQPLTLWEGALYGVANGGVTNGGIVFKLTL
jgi:hypothetical protein